jgi:hypothetical protein
MMVSHEKFQANFNATARISLGKEQWRGRWHIYDRSADGGEAIERGDAVAWHDNQNDAWEDARRGALERMKALSEAGA